MPLFYLTKSMEEGPPTEDCAESVVKQLTDNLLVAAIAATGAFMFFSAGCAAIPNCCGEKKEPM